MDQREIALQYVLQDKCSQHNGTNESLVNSMNEGVLLFIYTMQQPLRVTVYMP